MQRGVPWLQRITPKSHSSTAQSQLQACLHHPPQQGQPLRSSLQTLARPQLGWGGHTGTPTLLLSQYLQAWGSQQPHHHQAATGLKQEPSPGAHLTQFSWLAGGEAF